MPHLGANKTVVRVLGRNWAPGHGVRACGDQQEQHLAGGLMPSSAESPRLLHCTVSLHYIIIGFLYFASGNSGSIREGDWKIVVTALYIQSHRSQHALLRWQSSDQLTEPKNRRGPRAGKRELYKLPLYHHPLFSSYPFTMCGIFGYCSY